MSAFVAPSGGSGIARVAPSRDRRVLSVAAVPCPDCGVPAGTKCMRPNGLEAQTHKSRRRMAVRAQNASETYDVADVEYARKSNIGGRKTARARSGMTQAEAAAHLGVGARAFHFWETGQRSIAGPAGAAYGRWLRDLLDEAGAA